jgi:hypothetical protein
MKVEGPRAPDASGIRRAARPLGGQTVFSLDEGFAASKPAPVSGARSVGTVDSLLALQAVPDAGQGRARAFKRGQRMLDLLDEIRDGMLSGLVSQGSLRSLSAELQAQHDAFLEPGLQSVMNDIELRAQVELAKMQVLAARTDSVRAT